MVLRLGYRYVKIRKEAC